MRDSVLLLPRPRLGTAAVWHVTLRVVTCRVPRHLKIVAEQGTADHQGEDGDHHEHDEEDGQQEMPCGDSC